MSNGGDDDQQQDPENDAWLAAVLRGKRFYQQAGPPPTDLPVPIDFLRPHIEKYVAEKKKLTGAHRISIVRGYYASVAVRSTLFPKRETSVIVLHTGLNFCYRRFATAIEFANLLLGEHRAYRTVDILQHLAGLLAGFPAGPDTSLYAESLAPLIAVELLMPMAHEQTMSRLQNSSALEVATTFRVPHFVAEWSMAGAWRHRAELHRKIDDDGSV